MARIELRVAYEDKDEVKSLGARWDATARVWFVPEELDPARFERWRPADPPPNLRAEAYFMASSSRPCWRCGATSPVHGFMLPPGFETLYTDDASGPDLWETEQQPSLLCYVEWLAPAVAARLAPLAPHYRVAHSRSAGLFHWMNHCAHCGAPFGDHETFCEPGQGFLAFTLEQARRVTLARVDEPFAASCGGYSIGVSLFKKMRCV